MTRFISTDLSGLAPPPAVETLDYEATLAARLSDLGSRLKTVGLDELVDYLALETEPLTILEQVNSYFEMTVRARINDAVKANLIATATGADLDHLAATFYGVARLLITPANPNANPPIDDIYEDDDTYRARALLSMEARSVAGPEGAYVYFALQADPDVLDAACYSEEDGAKYADNSDVLAPEVLVVIMSRTGNGGASGPLIAGVQAALGGSELRPIGDKVVVESAAIVPYSVTGVVKYAPGADPGVIVAEATARLQSYADSRHRIGRIVQQFGLAAAMKVTNAEEIELTVEDQYGTPLTADIDPGSKGAAYCTDITITAEVATDSWRP